MKNFYSHAAKLAVLGVCALVCFFVQPQAVDAATGSCAFDITKDGVRYQGTTGSVGGRGTWDPVPHCQHMTNETLERIGPNALSAVWGVSCGNTHYYDAVIVQEPVNAACGAASGAYISQSQGAYYNNYLCNSGTAASGGAYSNGYNATVVTWECIGSAGGGNVGCNYTVMWPINGMCGAANGVTTAIQPLANKCASGNASETSPTATAWLWSCNGAYDGYSSSCAAPREICSASQWICDGRCQGKDTPCGGNPDQGDGSTVVRHISGVACPAGYFFCNGACIPDTEMCVVDTLITNFSVAPKIIAKDTDRCLASWTTIDQDGDPGTVITCTLNKSSAPANAESSDKYPLRAGNYDFSCVDNRYIQATTTKCNLIPTFQEF